jgi:hypothetical protein
MAEIDGSRMSMSSVEEIVEEEGECLVSSDASDDSGSDAEDDKPEKQGKQKRKGQLDFGNVDVNEDVVIPKNPFQGKEPDEKKYDLEVSPNPLSPEPSLSPHLSIQKYGEILHSEPKS